jgi:hypothetical protein
MRWMYKGFSKWKMAQIHQISKKLLEFPEPNFDDII